MWTRIPRNETAPQVEMRTWMQERSWKLLSEGLSREAGPAVIGKSDAGVGCAGGFWGRLPRQRGHAGRRSHIQAQSLVNLQ